MEKTITQEERLRRAEEIYQRRRASNGNGVRVSSSSVNKNKTKISLFKKMALQLAICSVIYIIFYLIKNTSYVFSDDVIIKTKELLSYDINFGNVYQQVSSFIERNKDKFTMTGTNTNEQSEEQVESENKNEEEKGKEEQSNVQTNEQKQEEQANQIEESTNIVEENVNETENTNKTNNNETTNTQGGIGGAETNEVQEDKTDETTKKSQMEIDAEYVKSKCNFKVPVKGTVTSRYGAREETEIVSANHYGIDIGADTGTAIYASMEGTVILVSSEGDYRKTHRNYKWRYYD